MPRRTYIDSCVLIAAFRGTEQASHRARALIADEERSFVASDILALECVAPAIRTGNQDQVEFCDEFIRQAEHVSLTDSISRWAIGILSSHTMQHMDLFHIAAAVQAEVDDFVTTEAPSKPFFTIGAPVNVVSL